MSPHSAHTRSGIKPALISAANSRQPRQSAKIDFETRGENQHREQHIGHLVRAEPQDRDSRGGAHRRTDRLGKALGRAGHELLITQARRDHLARQTSQRTERGTAHDAGDKTICEGDEQPVERGGERDRGPTHHHKSHCTCHLLVDGIGKPEDLGHCCTGNYNVFFFHLPGDAVIQSDQADGRAPARARASKSIAGDCSGPPLLSLLASALRWSRQWPRICGVPNDGRSADTKHSTPCTGTLG